MTDNDRKFLESLKHDLYKACASQDYFPPITVDNAAIMNRINDGISDMAGKYANQTSEIMSFDQESNTIIFNNECYFQRDLLPMIPFFLDGVEMVGNYELKVNGEIIGKVIYSGPVDPPEEGDSLIKVGAKTELRLYETIHRVTIDIDVEDGAS